MPYQDFRQFLDVLRQQGELIDVDRPIALTDVGKALQNGRISQHLPNRGVKPGRHGRRRASRRPNCVPVDEMKST